ncbi:MAG: MBL fold metallo-hydrolase [Clostridia bacterium]|nr:MBL fold metallo-hydrolase [Clostridia bacterium]
MINLAEYVGLGTITLEADSRLNDKDLIHVGDMEFIIIHTPGHTQGGICLYSEKEKLLFSGDTIFRDAWGRTDLPTSSFTDIIKSITEKIMVLPEDVIIYPGHRKIYNGKRMSHWGRFLVEQSH